MGTAAQREADIQHHLVVPVGGVQVELARGRDAVGDIPVGVAVADLILRIAAIAIPVVLGRARQVEAAIAGRQTLAHRGLQAPALGTLGREAKVALVQFALRHGVGQAEVAAGGIAIGRQRDVGVGRLDELAVAQADALTTAVRLPVQLGIGLRDVEAEGSVVGIQGNTGQRGGIVIRELHATIAGEQVGEAMLYGDLRERRRAVQTGVAVLTGSDAIASHTRSQRIDGGGVWHPGSAYPAIGLGHHHIEIAAVPGRVQVVDDEGARRHRGLVDDVAVLLHLHAGVGLRNTPYGRRISALRFRIHAVVGGQLRAGEAEAVEQCAVGEGLTEHQLALQRRNRALQVGLDVLILVTAQVVVAEVAGVAEAPAADIEPGI
ncbi:hypothetical protein D3C81_1195120 [compost metagenome]